VKRGLLAAAAFCGVTLGAFAYVRAADEPSGYVGSGQLVVQTTLGGDTKITVGGNIAIEEHGSLLRIDVLSLGIPGTNATTSSLMSAVSTQLFPPGGFTIVYDRKASTYTVWSNARHAYYTNASDSVESAPVSGAAGALPLTGAAVGIVAGNDLFSAFSFARSLKDDSAFTLSFSLAGHQTVNGHPATGLNFQYARTTKTGDALDLHGTFQFADDLDGLPVEITAAGHSRSIPDSAFRLDFSSLVKQSPPDADFVPPPNYSRANTLGDVIGKSLTGM
jgi:hypothetical protein